MIGPAVPATLFRWQFTDDGIGEQWSGWHVAAGRCATCCCGGGPDEDGEHREPAERYAPDGWLERGHAYYDPECPPMRVEWAPAGEPLPHSPHG